MKEEYLTGVKVKDAMLENVVTINENVHINDLKEIMLFKNKEEVLVTKNGCLVGIITKNDLGKSLVSGLNSLTVKDIMSKNVVCVHPNDNLYEARKKLREKGIDRAPVLDDNNNILGIVTVKSICDCFSYRLEDAVKYLQNVFDSISEAVLVIDYSGKMKYWNETAEKILNEKLTFNSHISIFLPEKIVDRIINIKSPSGEILFLDKNTRHYTISSHPIDNLPNFKGIIVNFKDVTRIFELKDKLETTNGRLMYLEEQFKKMTSDFSSFGELLYTSKTMEDIAELALKVSKTDATVLITGESGTGKELLANAIHQNSLRKDKPFIKINCSTIPQSLFESELFGFEKGSFTGAQGRKRGIFEAADGGTIFLDEIAELPMEMQAKLLRVLQEKSFYKIGGISPQEIDVRVIAATNRNLDEMIDSGLFREDLFYRLNVIKIEIPPLRERKEDILYLINHFLNYFKKIYNRRAFSIEPKVFNILENYLYPGNVRELKNIIERLSILADNGKITVSLLPSYIFNTKNNLDKKENTDNVFDDREEKLIILDALKKSKYNKSKAAKLLNVSRGTLYNKLKKYNLVSI